MFQYAFAKAIAVKWHCLALIQVLKLICLFPEEIIDIFNVSLLLSDETTLSKSNGFNQRLFE
jgi:hypothetical protein